MSKPRDEEMSQAQARELRDIAKSLGMENDDATELFVANNDRENTARGMEEWTKGNRPE